MLDWQSTLATLFSLVHGDVEHFAANHREERFYGLFLDCNSYYGDVFVNLNTPDLLRKQAQTYKHDLQSIAGPAATPDLYAHKSIGEIEEELRWSPGDWGYLQINRWDQWRERWEPVREAIELVRDDDDLFDAKFMEMICRLLIRIEQSGVLNLLTRTTDFTIMCADHDELLDHSQERLSRIRQQGNGGDGDGGTHDR